MIDGLNGLMAEIDKFKDSVQDTTVLFENLSLNSEMIKRNTQRIDELKNEIGESVKRSEEKLSFDIETARTEMLGEIKKDMQKIDVLRDETGENIKKSEEKLASEIKTIKTGIIEADTITQQKLKLLNNKLAISMGISILCAVCAIIILILNIIR